MKNASGSILTDMGNWVHKSIVGLFLLSPFCSRCPVAKYPITSSITERLPRLLILPMPQNPNKNFIHPIETKITLSRCANPDFPLQFLTVGCFWNHYEPRPACCLACFYKFKGSVVRGELINPSFVAPFFPLQLAQSLRSWNVSGEMTKIPQERGVLRVKMYRLGGLCVCMQAGAKVGCL